MWSGMDTTRAPDGLVEKRMYSGSFCPVWGRAQP